MLLLGKQRKSRVLMGKRNNMEWKLTKEAEEMKKKIASGEELDTSPFGGGDGFWYDLILGGYFNIDKVLADPEQIAKAKESIQILMSLEREVYSKIVPEF